MVFYTSKSYSNWVKHNYILSRLPNTFFVNEILISRPFTKIACHADYGNVQGLVCFYRCGN